MNEAMKPVFYIDGAGNHDDYCPVCNKVVDVDNESCPRCKTLLDWSDYDEEV